MEDNNYRFEPIQESEIDIVELIKKLLKERKFILRWCIIAAMIGVLVSINMPKQYEVSATLAPELANRSALTSGSLVYYAGLSSMLRQGTDAVYPDLYPEIVSSSPFLTEMFSTPVKFSRKKETVECDYYTYLRDYQKKSWLSTVIALPFKALSWFVKLFKDTEPSRITGYDNMDSCALSPEQGRIVAAIKRNVNILVDKKTFVITLNVTAQDPSVAVSIANDVINKLQSYVTEYRTQKSRVDLEYYKQLFDEAKDEYSKAQQEYAKFVDTNQGVVLQRVLIEKDRLQNETNLAYSIYNACAQQYQAAKAKVQQETPICTVINPPSKPIRPSTPGAMRMALLFIFLGLAASSFWIIGVRDWLKKLKS